MATNQIIPLRRTATGRRLKRRQSGRKPVGTTTSGQAARLGPRFEAAFEDVFGRRDIDVSHAPDAFAPERVLVFETIGDLANFAAAARRVGLEWLAEQAAMLDDVDYLA